MNRFECETDCELSFGYDLLRHFPACVLQLRGWDDLVDQSDAQSLQSIHRIAGEDHLHRLPFADEARQALGPSVPRNDTEIHFGLAELRVLRGNTNVARKRKLTASAKGVSIDGRNDRLSEVLNRGKHRLSACRELLSALFVQRRQFADIRAGDERLFTRSRDNDCIHCSVGLKLFEQLTQFLLCGYIEGVKLVRTIESDGTDAIRCFDNERSVFHRRFLEYSS